MRDAYEREEPPGLGLRCIVFKQADGPVIVRYHAQPVAPRVNYYVRSISDVHNCIVSSSRSLSFRRLLSSRFSDGAWVSAGADSWMSLRSEVVDCKSLGIRRVPTFL